jgi:hypothetical protein
VVGPFHAGRDPHPKIIKQALDALEASKADDT